MMLSLAVILEALPGCVVTGTVSPEQVQIARVSLLPEGAWELRRDHLYLCTLEQARRAAEQPEHGYFLCPAQPGEIPEDCILADGVGSVLALAELVLERTGFICGWAARLNESALEDPSYQTLLDLCEPVLGNPVYILDASYKLLAFTRNTLDDDEIDVHLRQTGYHSEETLTAFRNCRHLRASSGEVGTQVNPPGNPNKYATVSKRIRDRGMPVLHIIMVCSRVETPSPGLLALFEIAAQNCAVRFRQQQNFTPRTGRLYDSLLHDILFDRLEDPRTIAERARLAGLPAEGTFSCCTVALRGAQFYSVPRVLDELLALWPGVCAISHGYEIIVLDTAGQGDGLDALLAPFLEKFSAVCGVSEPFCALTDVPAAYAQSCRAIELGEALAACRPEWEPAPAPKGDGIFYYDDLFVYHALSQTRAGTADAFRNTPYLTAVRELIRTDRERDTNHARVLYTYLVSGRRATDAGELLHMHRNNVLYRIARIEEMTGMDLDDPWVRLKLLLAFLLVELEQAGAQNDR